MAYTHHVTITPSQTKNKWPWSNLNAISIIERPVTAEDSAVPGHWEGDLIFGSNNSQIATPVRAELLVRHETLLVIN